jgi:hypothetical protein
VTGPDGDDVGATEPALVRAPPVIASRKVYPGVPPLTTKVWIAPPSVTVAAVGAIASVGEAPDAFSVISALADDPTLSMAVRFTFVSAATQAPGGVYVTVEGSAVPVVVESVPSAGWIENV